MLGQPDPTSIELASALEDMLRRQGDPVALIAAMIEEEIAVVIDAARSGRTVVGELEKVEKTYIGTRIERALRSLLVLARGERLDLLLDGVEFDCKWSLYQRYMIPPEAFGRHCLVIGLDQRHGTFQLGLVRVDLDVLSASENRDRKRTFAPIFDARTGLDRADSVAWIIRRGRMKTPASLCHGKTTNLPVATALLATFPA